MTVLISGATGLVGKKLVKTLTKQNIKVHILSRSSANIFNDNKLVKVFKWNVDEQQIDLNCFEGVVAIIHLAGAPISKFWTDSYKKEIYNSRILSTKLLFNSLKELQNHSVKQFISASGISVYPDDNIKIYTEDLKFKPHNFLSKVVLDWEGAANEFESLGILVSKVRTGLVLDFHQGAFPIMYKTTKRYLGTTFGNGKQIFSWIHIQDLIGIYVYILNNKLHGVFNAVASEPELAKDFSKKLANATQTAIILPKVPGFVLRTLMREMSVLVLEGCYVSNAKILSAGYVFKFDKLEIAFRNIIYKK